MAATTRLRKEEVDMEVGEGGVEVVLVSSHTTARVVEEQTQVNDENASEWPEHRYGEEGCDWMQLSVVPPFDPPEDENDFRAPEGLVVVPLSEDNLARHLQLYEEVDLFSGGEEEAPAQERVSSLQRFSSPARSPTRSPARSPARTARSYKLKEGDAQSVAYFGTGSTTVICLWFLQLALSICFSAQDSAPVWTVVYVAGGLGTLASVAKSTLSSRERKGDESSGIRWCCDCLAGLAAAICLGIHCSIYYGCREGIAVAGISAERLKQLWDAPTGRLVMPLLALEIGLLAVALFSCSKGSRPMVARPVY